MQKRLNLVPFFLFIISGGCGLVYEVTWARYLALFLGYTTLAHMCVLAAFMGGLALGSVLIGRMTAGFRRPLAVYGLLEIIIGVYALASPAIIGIAESLTLTAGAGMPPGSPSWLGLKMLVSVGVLLFPTVLMGGTFPVLMRYFHPRTSSEDKSEWLYLMNCVGAVAGTLLAGFALIPQLGMQFTLYGIGAVNAVLGLCAVGLSMLEPADAFTRKPDQAEADYAPRHPLALPVYIAIAVSGFTSMVYELAWIKIFAMTLGSSTYSFTLMLAAFISGISLGSLLVGIVPVIRRNPLVSFAVAEIAIGLVVVLSLPVYERLPYIFWQWSSLLNRTPEAFGLFNLVKYSLCFTVMVVPTLFFGMTLPLAIKAIARHDERIGRDSGFVYGANTAGTLIGALLTGLVFIRVLGLRHSLEMALVINILAGVMLLLASSMSYRRVAAGFACLAMTVLVFAMPKWDPMSFVMGTFRNYSTAPESWQEFQQSNKRLKLTFYREDNDGMVAVVKSQAGEEMSLLVNGKADASSHGDVCTQTLVGHLPMFFQPDAKDVLVVGLGSGITVNSSLTHPGVKADCVEISPAVAEAARQFHEFNGRIHENKRMNLIIEDARSYVAVTDKKYDVVVNEPTNPWIAGVGNLFSREYYLAVDRILRPGGVMAMWIQRYELSDELGRTMLRTALTVFPYLYVFEAQPDDYVVLVSREPLKPDFRVMQKRLKVPAVKNDLNRISVDSLIALLGRQCMDPGYVRSLAGETGDINTDDYPVLEFRAPESQFVANERLLFDGKDQRLLSGRGLFVADYLGGRTLTDREIESLIRSYSHPLVRRAELTYALVSEYLSRWPDDPWALRLFASVSPPFDQTKAASAALAIKGELLSVPATVEIQAQTLSKDLMSRHSVFTPQDFFPAVALLEKALRGVPDNEMLMSTREQVLRAME